MIGPAALGAGPLRFPLVGGGPRDNTAPMHPPCSSCGPLPAALLGLSLGLAGCTPGAAAAPTDAAQPRMDPPCSIPIDGVMRSRALSCYRGCPAEMFEPGATVYAFADEQSFAQVWGRQAGVEDGPALDHGALRFGPQRP